MADVQELRKVEKAMVKLRNKAKRADLNYTVQVSINSTDPTKMAYAAQMTAPAEGLAPVTFISYESFDDLLSKIKTATKGIDFEEIEKAYHAAQIEACERTIAFHKDRVARIDNPEAEDGEAEAQPTETENVDVPAEETKEG
jgi:hypothetical protein